MPKSTIKSELPILDFSSQSAFEDWLEQNYQTSPGIWLKFYKKGSNVQSVVYAEAVESALIYGWIDSQAKSLDEIAYLQRFTPRRSRSIWSKVNIANIERLTKAGRMKPSGLTEVAAAKADGRWDAAYDSPQNTKIPEDFLAELSKHKKAEEFFKTLNKTNLYAICWRLQTAKKPETRLKRMISIIEMLKNQKKFH